MMDNYTKTHYNKVLSLFKERHDILWLYLFGILAAISYILNAQNGYISDTYTYVAAWKEIKISGIDIFRTPVYPIFIGLITDFFGENQWMRNVVIAQFALFLLSFISFEYIAKSLINSRLIRFILCFVFITSPFTAGANIWIMTEGVSVSLLTIYVACVIRTWYSGATLIRGIYIILATVLLIMLRPSFLFLIPCDILFAFMLWKERGASPQIYCSIALIPIVIVFLYACIFNHFFGSYSISGIGAVNQYGLMVKNGSFNPNIIENKKMAEDIRISLSDTVFSYGPGTPYAIKESNLIDDYGINNFGDACMKCNKADFKNYCKQIILRLVNESNASLIQGQGRGMSLLCAVSNLRVNLIYFLFVCFALWSLHIYKVLKSIPFIPLFLYIMALANFCAVIVASWGDWGRLFLPSTIILFILTAVMCDSLKFSSYICDGQAY